MLLAYPRTRDFALSAAQHFGINNKGKRGRDCSSVPIHPISRDRAMREFVMEFLRNESGATAIEYGLIAALIAVVSISTLRSVGTKLNTKFGSVSGALG